MDWTDEAIVLSARKHGENAVILSLLTRDHGRHLGLVRGGAGRRARGLYESGNRVQATWQARLSEHLGHFVCEPIAAQASILLDEPARLAALTAAVALVDLALPERAPHSRLFEGLGRLIDELCRDAPGAMWATRYARFEIDLLAELGFGLDLERCAATGTADDLAYVSPKSGRAVSRAAAEPYRDKLLPLPAFLRSRNEAPATVGEVLTGLELTGFFLDRHVLAHYSARPREGPGLEARTRLVDRLRRMRADEAGTSRKIDT